MKSTLITFFALFLFKHLHSQVLVKSYTSRQIWEKGINGNLNKLNEILIDAFASKLVTKDIDNKEYNFIKFAESKVISIPFINFASKEIGNGIANFRLKLTSAKATSLTVYFDELSLSKNAELFIYNSLGTTILGPVTKAENIPKGKLWGSALFMDNSIVLELKVPIAEVQEIRLHIAKVLKGIPKERIVQDKDSTLFGFGEASPCNNSYNVICPAGNGWENERRAICRIRNDEGGGASGALVMNTCNTNKPFVLTAYHVTNGRNVANMIFDFFWWSPTCLPSTYSAVSLLFNGATLKATYEQTDFSLLELMQTPAPNSGLSYLGWSRSSIIPSSTTCLHHPQGDQMKISFDNKPAIIGSVLNFPNTAWRVLWDAGATEKGSSGSPLFDPSHRVIGQNFSSTQPTYPPCNQQTGGTNFGRFDMSWTGGGTPATRLSNWLDPNGSNVMQTTTTNISALTAVPIAGSFLPITGNAIVCGTTQTYSISGIAANATVVWQLVSPTVGSGYQLPWQNVCTKADNGSQTTLTKINNGNLKLFATITNCSGVVQYASKDITFGAPPVLNNGAYASNISTSWYKLISGTVNTTDGYNTWISMANPANVQYTFYKTGGSSNATWSSPTNGNVNILFSKPVTTSSNIGFSVNASNACGSSSAPIMFYYNGTPIYFKVTPNPANNIITISADNKLGNNALADIQTAFIKEVKLTDKEGNIKIVKSFNGNSKTVSLNTGNLPTGIYNLHIFNGKSWTVQKLLVQR